MANKTRTPKRVLISAHSPTIKAPLEDYDVPLHGIEQPARKFPDHEVILGIDAETKVCGFEDGWHVGLNTKPSNLTSKEQERSSPFTIVSFLQTRGDERKWWERRQRNRGTTANFSDTWTRNGPRKWTSWR